MSASDNLSNQHAETPPAGQDGENIVCPFCSDGDFDRYGLKQHYIAGWCAKAPELGGFYDPVAERDTLAAQLAQAQGEVKRLKAEFDCVVGAENQGFKAHEETKAELATARAECERLREVVRNSQFVGNTAIAERDNRRAENEDLRAENADLARDKARLDWLEAQLNHPHYWRDIILSWDHEDGTWLSTIKRGDYVGARPMEFSERPLVGLRAAIDAALAKHQPNKTV